MEIIFKITNINNFHLDIRNNSIYNKQLTF